MDEEATSKKMKKSRRGRRTTKRKTEMHPEIKESLKLSDKGSFSKLFPLDQSISIQGCYYNCNLLTLQISIDILSIFFNKQSFTFMLPFIYFIYLHLIHLCCKLSVILISPVIPLLIVPSGYVIRGEVLTILINRNQTSDVKSPAKCHEWGKIGWPVHL